MHSKSIKGLVSIGLPTYNRPDLLKRVLGIIATQTYGNFEIIVSDNASPDPKVKEIIEEFAAHDSRIKYFKQDRNIGVLANAAFVLNQSKGEYFTWFSDDDWRSPEFIEILVGELEKNKEVNFAFCDYNEVNEDGSRAKGYPSSHLKVFKPFESHRRLIRTLYFYWQRPISGNRNLFYSVYRKEVIDRLNLEKISAGFQHLCMDALVIFTLLQNGPVSIRSEAMCALTCGNKKYYFDDELQTKKGKKTFLSKFTNFWNDNKKNRDLYIINTNSSFEKIIIFLSFFPKIVVLLAPIIFKKLLEKIKSLKHEKNSCEPSNLQNKSANKLSPDDNKKIQLRNVTLVAMATKNVEETLQALIYSCKGIEFGSVKLLSHYTPYGIDKKVEFIRIEKINSIDEWSYKIIYELNQYIETDFALLVHADGFVVNPTSWKDEFLDYDYIGAPWPLPKDNFSYRDIHGNIVRIGNSVSMRSKRLLELPIKLNMPWEPYHGYWNEDGFICVKNKHIYEANGMKFATLEVAKYFSHEAMIPEVCNIKPFMFHKWAGSNQIYPKF